MSSRLHRIALYSHDTMGLGHMRRNMLLAEALARSVLRPSLLLIAGAPEARAFVDGQVSCVTLPALTKHANGNYTARATDLSLEDVRRLRAKIIEAAVGAFSPDLFIVDNVPRGALCELDGTLDLLRRGRHARCVLGLRDVLDDPSNVAREWGRLNNESAVDAYYDAVWIYGDPRVYDTALEYGFGPRVTGKVVYTGYLDPRSRIAHVDPGAVPPASVPDGARLLLCLCGGGQDGAALADAFAHADWPGSATGVIVAGPCMPVEARRLLHAAAARRPRLTVHDSVPEPLQLIARAERVVAMGGYNTVCEVLAHRKRTLIVPRVSPRREQWVRAERLRQLGLLDVLAPDRLTSGALADWLADAPPSRDSPIDMDGLRRVPDLAAQLLQQELKEGTGPVCGMAPTQPSVSRSAWATS